MVEAVRPEADDDVVFLGDVAQGRRDTWREVNLQKAEHSSGMTIFHETMQFRYSTEI